MNKFRETKSKSLARPQTDVLPMITVGTVIRIEKDKYYHIIDTMRAYKTTNGKIAAGVGYFVCNYDINEVIHKIIFGEAFIVKQKEPLQYKLSELV